MNVRNIGMKNGRMNIRMNFRKHEASKNSGARYHTERRLHVATERCLYENERFLKRMVIGIIMKSAAKS